MKKKQQLYLQAQRSRRKKKVRAKISGTAKRPRVSVYKSLRYLSAQAIDDVAGKTVAAINEKSAAAKAKGDKKQAAQELGTKFAKVLQEKKVKAIVFDRRNYKYHGRVKAFADGLREAGIEF